jgi:hypothetical protein
LRREQERIEAAGGIVRQYYHDIEGFVGPHRVWKKNCDYPALAVSRGIGDLIAGEVGYSNEPFIQKIPYSPG